VARYVQDSINQLAVHTVQTSRYHPVALVERGNGVETQSSVGHMPRQPTILAAYRYTASPPDNGHDLLKWVMQRHTSVIQVCCKLPRGQSSEKLYQQSCLQQTINKLHKVITYFIFTASIFKTLVSILQRVIRRDKHPHHAIRIDQPSLLWLRPQRVIKNVSSSRGTLNYSLDVLDVSMFTFTCYIAILKRLNLYRNSVTVHSSANSARNYFLTGCPCSPTSQPDNRTLLNYLATHG
jgi:hypothetical protein